MKIKDKIIRVIFIGVFTGLLVAVGILATNRYTDINEDDQKAVSAYQRLQLYVIHYLENAEAFILLYPLEGGESPNQLKKVAQAKVLESKIDGKAELLEELTDKVSKYNETRGFKAIADEMNIYMNYFETERYPANATNLNYMNNLFKLMGNYRHAIEEELDAYRAVDEKDVFNSETYIKYKAIKQGIEDENTWELSPISTGNENDPELGPKLSGIDRIPTLIHTEDEGLPFAKAYFDEAYGDVSLDDIEISGGGGSNIHGRMFLNYDYKYGNEEVHFYETGDIEHIQYNYDEDLASDESSWSMVTDENFEAAERIAEDYLLKHNLSDYGIGSYNLGYSGGNSGYINLIYSYSTTDDYYDDLNTVEFTFLNGDEVLLESVWYPRNLYHQVLDTSRFEEGYKKKSKFMDMLKPYYNITDAFYQNGQLEGNVQTYEWRFIVLEGVERYFVIVDADTEEVTGTYPVPEEWIMNGSD